MAGDYHFETEVVHTFAFDRPQIKSLATGLPSQSDFGKVYSVKGQNMKKLECPSFPMVFGV